MSLRENPLAKVPTSRPIERKLKVAILVCPCYFLPDVIGVQTVYGLLPNTELSSVWKNKDEIEGMPCFTTRATATFAECPRDLDLFHVGAVSLEVMEDPEVLAFVAEVGGRAKWVSGVCGGALLLGAAGLLKGYRATTNFHMHDQLAFYGAKPTKANVVVDGNRVTSGPVSGSFDLALRLLEPLVGEDIGREVELQMEWAPEPPYHTGSPELAGPELTAKANAALAPLTEAMRQIGIRAARRLEIR
jgi:cyclohexyl-isocyanide hydratase